jgi:hypothetical protein
MLSLSLAGAPMTESFDVPSSTEWWQAFRVRMRFFFARYLADKPFALKKVELFEETYQGSYTGGRELPISCGSERGFSVEPPLSTDLATDAAAAAVAKCATSTSGSTSCTVTGKRCNRKAAQLWICKRSCIRCQAHSTLAMPHCPRRKQGLD